MFLKPKRNKNSFIVVLLLWKRNKSWKGGAGWEGGYHFVTSHDYCSAPSVTFFFASPFNFFRKLCVTWHTDWNAHTATAQIDISYYGSDFCYFQSAVSFLFFFSFVLAVVVWFFSRHRRAVVFQGTKPHKPPGIYIIGTNRFIDERRRYVYMVRV